MTQLTEEECAIESAMLCEETDFGDWSRSIINFKVSLFSIEFFSVSGQCEAKQGEKHHFQVSLNNRLLSRN